MPEVAIEKRHRFLDETGDPTFYGKGRKLILGEQGVSLSFGIGIVRIDAPLDDTREKIKALATLVEGDPLLYTIPSVQKRIQSGGFFFMPAKTLLRSARSSFAFFEVYHVRQRSSSRGKSRRGSKKLITAARKSSTRTCSPISSKAV
jgi:hypothetical protein